MSPRNITLTFLVFLLEPLAFGAWLAMLPDVKDALGLSKAQLAVSLLGMPLGVVTMLQFAGTLMGRWGPRRMLAVGYILQAFAIFLPLLAWDRWSLMGALYVLGLIFGMLQVGLNVYAGRLEKETDQIIMNRCHGFWALGVMLGSLGVAVMAGTSIFVTMALIAFPSAVFGAWCSLALVRLREGEGSTAQPRRAVADIPRRLALIAICTLAASMTEGAMSDWAAIYLAERLPPEAEFAGIAVSIFAGFLAAGRFAGDAANRMLGVVRLARLALGCALVGLASLVLPLPLTFAYLGFALIGLGVSVGFPLGVTAAAGLDDTHEGANIAIVSTVTMAGFLIGPPLIGGLAEYFSLRVGFLALSPGLLAGIALAWVLAPVTRSGDSDESAAIQR